jgi:hypothetical protein
LDLFLSLSFVSWLWPIYCHDRYMMGGGGTSQEGGDCPLQLFSVYQCKRDLTSVGKVYNHNFVMYRTVGLVTCFILHSRMVSSVCNCIQIIQIRDDTRAFVTLDVNCSPWESMVWGSAVQMADGKISVSPPVFWLELSFIGVTLRAQLLWRGHFIFG